MIEILSRYSQDIPFAGIYSFQRGVPVLETSTGADLPSHLTTDASRVAREGKAEILQLAGVARAERVMLSPMLFPGQTECQTVLALGMRGCEESEELYRSYLEVIAAQVTDAVGNVNAHHNAELISAQARDLRRSNDELERFAYTASHDLQEPLRTVIAFTQLLARKHTGKFSTEDDENISFILEAANRMSRLISGLLEYSRVGETGILNRDLVDLESVLGDVKVNLSFAISDTDAQITSDPLPSVPGDRNMLSQLFQNLISNAIRYRNPETAPAIHVSSSNRFGNDWLFSVRDNGIGFNQEYAETIFGVFKRLHGRKFQGTGIGLAICRKIVERHGGHIWAESTEGKGATFIFTLPARA